MLNIDIPIALGIIGCLKWSTVDIDYYGSGFFDSLTGLIFFMLLERCFK
jgi:Cu+-exporting ATPase